MIQPSLRKQNVKMSMMSFALRRKNSIIYYIYKLRRGHLMSIYSILSTLMGSRRYSIQDVREKTRLLRNTISNLYSDRATRIDFEVIDKLCVLLG